MWCDVDARRCDIRLLGKNEVFGLSTEDHLGDRVIRGPKEKEIKDTVKTLAKVDANG